MENQQTKLVIKWVDSGDGSLEQVFELLINEVRKDGNGEKDVNEKA